MEKEYIQLPALKRDLDPDVERFYGRLSNYLRNTKHAIRSNMNC